MQNFPTLADIAGLFSSLASSLAKTDSRLRSVQFQQFAPLVIPRSSVSCSPSDPVDENHSESFRARGTDERTRTEGETSAASLGPVHATGVDGVQPQCAKTAHRGPQRAKIGPDEVEPEGFGGSKVEGENEVWPDLRRNPKGWGQFSRFRCRSSLADTRYPPHGPKARPRGPRYASLLAPRTRKNWLPAPPPG
jgi:hypothetical protein